MAENKKTTTTKAADTKKATASTVAATTAKKAEVKAEVKETAKAVAKKEPAKKVEKKATKSDADKAAKKAAKKPAKKVERINQVFVQNGGQDVVETMDLLKRIEALYVADGHYASSIKDLRVYLNIDERKAYPVINGKPFGDGVEF